MYLSAVLRHESSPSTHPHAFHGELTEFLRVHLGRGPGMLWPEHEDGDPADWDRPWADRLAADLTHLLRLPVRHVPDPDVPDPRTPTHHLLILQATGASLWHLWPAAGADARPQSLRLRVGEALYVPADCPAAVEHRPTARHLSFALSTALPG